MAQCTRVGGWITKPTVLEDLSMLMVMFMMDTGLMIKHMVTVFTAILMELDMKENGKKISNTEMDLKPGQMAQNSVDNTSKERNTEKVLSLGLTDLLTLDNLLRTTFKEMESITGLMAESSMDHG